MERKHRIGVKFIWSFGLIVLGLLLNFFSVGLNEFVGYPSVGSFLIYIGFLGFVVVIVSQLRNKDRVRDERMEFVAAKALRLTFLAFILVAFVLMVWDGISPITMPYSLFLSYLVSGLVAVLFISYHVLLRRY